MDFFADLSRFLWESIANLITLLTGVVGFMFELVRRRLGYELSNYWYIRVALVCLMFGMFAAWREKDDQVAELQRKIGEEGSGEMGAELANLQEQFGPRQITREKKDLLIQRLKGKSEDYILIITTLEDEDTDSAKYAADFIEVFEKAGWRPQVRQFRGVIENVWIHAKRGNPVADFLLTQFREPDVDIEAQLYPLEGTYWNEREIVVSVGPRQIR